MLGKGIGVGVDTMVSMEARGSEKLEGDVEVHA